MATPTMPRWKLIRSVMTLKLKIGVRISSSTMRRTIGTVRCPMSEASPRPTMNPMVASRAIHSPISTISVIDGDGEVRVVVDVVLVGDRDGEGTYLGLRRVGRDGGRAPVLRPKVEPGGGPLELAAATRHARLRAAQEALLSAAEVEVADHLVGVRRGPRVEGRLREPGRDVDPVEVELRRGGEDAHRAHDRVPHRHDADDDGEAGGIRAR